MDSNSQSPCHARVGSIGSGFSNVLVRGVWYAFGIPSLLATIVVICVVVFRIWYKSVDYSGVSPPVIREKAMSWDMFD